MWQREVAKLEYLLDASSAWRFFGERLAESGIFLALNYLLLEENYFRSLDLGVSKRLDKQTDRHTQEKFQKLRLKMTYLSKARILQA